MPPNGNVRRLRPLGWVAVAGGALAGVLLALALPPFHVWECGWLFPIPLMFVAAVGTRLECVAAAYVAGFVGIGPAAYGLLFYDPHIWLLVTMLGPAIIVLPIALCRWTTGPNDSVWVFSAPFLWVASGSFFLDILRMPFDFGITQVSGLLPLQLASVIGSTGLTFLITLTGVLGARAGAALWRADRRAARRWLALTCVVPVSAIGAGRLLLAGAPVDACLTTVRSAQPTIAFARARDSWAYPDIRAGIRADFDRYLAGARDTPGDLLVWPEGGGAFANLRLGDWRDALTRYVRDTRTSLLVSMVDFDEQGRKFNALFALDSAGVAKYDKRLPVPFAENDVVAGERAGVVPTAHGQAGLLICYDSCFPEPARQATRDGADFLVVSTSGTAFGVSALPDLHLSMSVLRAVENRRSVLHASNGGPSAIVDPFGRITAQTHLMERTTLSGCLWKGSGSSSFTRFGYRFRFVASLVGLALLAGATIQRIRRRRVGGSALWRPAYRLIAVALVLCVCGSLLVVASSSWILTREAAAPEEWPERDNASFWQPSELPPALDADRPLAWNAEELAYLASYYGVLARPADVLHDVRASGGGSDGAALTETVRRLGFQVQAMHGQLQDLGQEPFPVLVEFAGARHAVLLDLSDDRAVFFEPPSGLQSLPPALFAHLWTGRWLRIRPPHFAA